MSEPAFDKSIMLKLGALFLGVFIFYGAIDKNNSEKSTLLNLANALEAASENMDTRAPTLLFDQLTELQYKYQNEKNMPCLQAVMALTGSADEVNQTGHWTGKDETLTAINQCKG